MSIIPLYVYCSSPHITCNSLNIKSFLSGGTFFPRLKYLHTFDRALPGFGYNNSDVVRHIADNRKYDLMPERSLIQKKKMKDTKDKRYRLNDDRYIGPTIDCR